MKAKKIEPLEECQQLSLDYGSYGYPCHRRKGHEPPHETLDKDDCPHTWRTPEMRDR